MPFALAALVFLIWVLLFLKTPWYSNYEAKRRQRKINGFLEKTRPAREERLRFVKEEVFPVYKEMFRKGPIGYWTDPRDAFSRVVTYEDWEFREDGTGRFIYFTLGSGENIYPFIWKSIADFQIEMTALKPPNTPEDEELEENDDDYFSMLPRETKITYDFVFMSPDSASITLQSNNYDQQQKPTPGQIELLSLERGPIKDALKKRFEGKY